MIAPLAISLRQSPPASGLGRLALALLLSINLHLYLLVSVKLGAPEQGGAAAIAIDARIELNNSAADTQRANSTPQFTVGVQHDSFPFAAPPPLLTPPSRSRVLPLPPMQVSLPVRLPPDTEPALPLPIKSPAPADSLTANVEATMTNVIPFAADTRYYASNEIDRLPVPLRRIVPEHPPAARGVAGAVTLQLSIDETGAVTAATVANADPPGVFDGAALAAFQPARFHPAQKDGHTVRSRVLVKVKFAAEP